VWLYLYRGALTGEFRQLCRRTTLGVLSWRPPPRHRVLPGSWRAATAFATSADILTGTFAAATVGFVFQHAVAELRLQSPADYDTLADARALLAGGQWVP